MFNKKHFDHRLDILELYLTVRDPGTAKAAEAYDGLRKLLIAANKGTQIHLAHLASLHKVAHSADSLAPIQSKVNEFMSQVGLVTVDDPGQVDLYQITGGKGTRLVVDAPAYLAHGGDGRPVLVQQGVAHYEEGPSINQTVSRESLADGGDADSSVNMQDAGVEEEAKADDEKEKE